MTAERAHTSYRAELAQTELQLEQAQQAMLNSERVRKRHQTYEMDLIAQTQDTQVELGKVAKSDALRCRQASIYLHLRRPKKTFDQACRAP